MRRLAVALVLVLSSAALADDPTDEESTAWAKKIEETIRARDPAFLDKSFDLDAIADKALEGLDMKPEARRGFVAGMKKGVKPSKVAVR